MGYHIAVWEGERPADDDAARHECLAVIQRYLINEPEPPSPAIGEFVAALMEIWPDNPADPRAVTSPWKCFPALDEAAGPVILLDFVLDSGVIAGAIIASMAQERGLVAFDLMVGMMRPAPEEVVAEHARRWADPLN